MAGSSSASRLSSAALWLSESSSGNTMVPPGFIPTCVCKKNKKKKNPPPLSRKKHSQGEKKYLKKVSRHSRITRRCAREAERGELRTGPNGFGKSDQSSSLGFAPPSVGFDS